MSEKVVRQSLTLKGRSTRSVEERVALRFPRLTAFVAGAVLRLPTRSRLRQAVVHRTVVLGWEAMNRGDLDAGLVLYHPDVESIFDPGAVALGFENSRGREARRRTLAEWYAETRELRLAPDELIDLGDGRFLVIGRMKGSGLRSGAPMDSEWANVWTISAGQVIRDQQFMSRSQALEAVGLRE